MTKFVEPTEHAAEVEAGWIKQAEGLTDKQLRAQLADMEAARRAPSYFISISSDQAEYDANLMAGLRMVLAARKRDAAQQSEAA
jgi:hypothetical protein